MHAIHSIWTKPRIAQSGSFFLEDFDILTAVLSALKWREKNGEISLITDSVGYNFFKERGLINIWDSAVCDLDNIPDTVNPEIFWAGGKLFALKNVSAPVTMLDTDFIVWDSIAFSNLPDLSVIHSEDIYPDVYPDIGTFKMNQGYVFNPEFDWRVRPYNTAFCVIKSKALKDCYTAEAISFMENAKGDDKLTYMVFAEQRLLSMIAKMTNSVTKEISTIDNLFRDGERYFTHIWGMKQQMREDDALRYDFCKKCIRRISEDFSEVLPSIKNIPELKRYFNTSPL